MDFNGTFFATIITFLVFVFIMNKILYEPVDKIINQRKELIGGNYEAADENNHKAEELSAEREAKLIEAKEDAKDKYNELVADYKEKRAGIVKDAQDKSHEELENAYLELNNVTNQTKENLKQKMTDLANDIVEKVLGYRSEIQGFNNDKINEILYNEKG